ncbi:prostaglandin reductase-3-like [Watersipora subatra]|uniref:prostaglandin reductase-3-like n=1 Tax=Watersipora subatra TaxID=2589382 RepID=UPI00355B3DBD
MTLWRPMAVPQTFRRLMVNRITYKFREACSIESVKTPKLGENDMLVKTRFVGINASDVNFSAGRYDPSKKPPFSTGFEGLGEVVQKGSNVTLPLSQPVAYMSYGAFGEYHVINQREAIPLPVMNKEFLSLLVSGLTAGISLEKTGEIKKGETVLVTAAAGGTGQFAVQLAKITGCHVIGTCSTDSKAALLKELGCDRVVNYQKENLGDVLRKEYPRGVDVVYESVGGEMFDTCVNNLAQNGRLIVIGWISGYQSSKGFATSKTSSSLPQRLLPKSASIRGFFLFNHSREIKPTAMKLFELYTANKLKCLIDNGVNSDKGPFLGLESIFDAVDYLYSKNSIGKIIVEIPSVPGSKL